VKDFFMDDRRIVVFGNHRDQPVANFAARHALRAETTAAELTTALLIHAGVPQ
jgi:hypothetical protein